MLSAGIVAALCSVIAYNGHTQNETAHTGKSKSPKLDSLQRADSLFEINHAAQKRALQMKRDQATAEIEKFDASVKKAASDEEQMEIDLQRAELEIKRAEFEIDLAEIEIARSKIAIAIADIHIAQADIELKEFDALYDELQKNVKEKITSFELNSEALIINGKKQSDALHREMRKKHLKPKTSVFYLEKNGSKTISITDDEKK